ncbi:hypothetical protein [Nonomuraea gerenzanensis]|uniref:hypothetical protein n=1 Tax=Nonomuraea gerenzanensis TaxID=93944 RepID=UPI001CD994D4|nr:hypothetical protein [Nonomuraea gerenzanensis]UBU12504.1 hypothetical protein LCN96_50925 [Nonomuraea gerenzanensis]
MWPDEQAPSTRKHWATCTDVSEFLDQVRLRPRMWLRDGSLRHLESLLLGYQIALGVHSIDEPFAFGNDGSFTAWLWRRIGRSSSLGGAIETERETPAGSTPIAEFFLLLDDFRRETGRTRPQASSMARA